MKRCPLSRALAGVLPDAVLTRHHARPWHSATFSGQRLVLELALDGADAESRAQKFMAEVGDHQFALPGLLVADITASRQAQDVGGAVTVTVEALLLDEDS